MGNVLRQYKLLCEYEEMRDLSRDPKEIERANREIRAIKISIKNYIDEYIQVADNKKLDIPQNIRSLLMELQCSGEFKPEINNMIKILFLSSSPTDEAKLRVDKEAREIQEKLQLAKMRDNFEYQIRLAVRPDDLTQALFDIEPKIVHFAGHGAESGELVLENEKGKSHPVKPEALASLFKLVCDQVECVLLNACYTTSQAHAISQHIQYVIGMNKGISDKAAIAFSVGFYQALGAGKSIEQSYEFGVVQIRLQDIPEHLTPIIIKKN
jgi:CHAT domain-containing protein